MLKKKTNEYCTDSFIFFIYLLLYIYYKTLNIGHNLTLFA